MTSSSIKKNNTKSKITTKQMSKTKKINEMSNFNNFKSEIVKIFFEMLLTVKLFHWNTYDYSSHKASDELYENLNENIDKFIEVLLGKTTNLGRIKLNNNKMNLTILNMNDNKLKEKINTFKKFLVNLNTNNNMKLFNMSNDDLFNIRDELLANLNQFLYLLSLH